MRHDWYPRAAELIYANLWQNNPIKIALLAPAYVPNGDTHLVWPDVSVHEISGPGYTSGGELLVGKSAPYDVAQDRTDLRADDVQWGPGATFSLGFAAVYDSSGSQPLWSLINLEGTKSVNNGVFVVDWATVGALAVLPGVVAVT